MSDVLQISTEDVPCYDPECEGVAEAEVDGDLVYWTCNECGFEFGYQKVAQPQEGSCAIGVPENVRRQFSADENWEPPIPNEVPVTLGRKR